MSLRKKILLSFFVSAAVIAILLTYIYANFIEIRKEIRYLESTDTVRSKTLQLRRHEKNYFLTGDVLELRNVYDYLSQLKKIIGEAGRPDRSGNVAALAGKLQEYEGRIMTIEKAAWDFRQRFATLKPLYTKYPSIPLIESTFLERPLENKALIETIFTPRDSMVLAALLMDIDADTVTLRKSGEEILNLSKELDKTARQKVEGVIGISQTAILLIFPGFVLAGVGIFFYLMNDIVKRLELLMATVEKAGQGEFMPVSGMGGGWGSDDEVGVLIGKFNTMEEQLSQRERELLQSRKLAAIGTFASGVAHELNNPLNNIYTTAQRLMKKAGEDSPDYMKKGIGDIFAQTMRVKSIVSDLLEFARGREPHFMAVELRRLITGAYTHVKNSRNLQGIWFSLEMHPEEIVLYADTELLERVFINLFSNAVDAMSGQGKLLVKAGEDDSVITLRISDTGSGMSRETLDKIFEPFFTTKDKGTGLGLAIVFNLIQKHHGEISAESEEGKGTAFTIILPKHAGNAA